MTVFPDINLEDLQAIVGPFRQSLRALTIPHTGSEKAIVTVSIGAGLTNGSNVMRGPADLRMARQGIVSAQGRRLRLRAGRRYDRI